MTRFPSLRAARQMLLVWGVALAAVCPSHVASAQPADPPEAAEASLAEKLVAQGQAALNEGHPAKALVKFQRSVFLDNNPAALLGLAESFFRLRKTASSWAVLRAAEKRARFLGETARAEVAAHRADELEPLLTRLKVTLTAGSNVAQVLLDGESIRSWIGTAVPVDPGTRRLVATAPGMLGFSTNVELPLAGGTREVAIPDLEPLPPLPPPPPEPVAPMPMKPHRREPWGQFAATSLWASAVVVGGAGLVTMGVGFHRQDQPTEIAGGTILESALLNTCLGIVVQDAGRAPRSTGRPIAQEPYEGLGPAVGRDGVGLVLRRSF
jgi:hypothetical protein